MKIKNGLRSSLSGTAKVAAPALVTLGLLGYAVPGTAGATPATYTAQAQSDGLVINLFGTQLTGGTAKASVDSEAPSADAVGTGTLTPGVVSQQTAHADATNTSQNKPKACAQGGGTPAGTPLGVTLGLSCSSASASITDGNVPAAAATGDIAGLDVNLSGVLNQIISSGGDQLFSGIQQILGQLNASPLGTGASACPDPNSPSGTSSSSTSSSSTSGSTTPTTAASNPLSALAGTAAVPGSPLNTLLGSLGLSSSPAAASPGPLGSLLQGLCQTLTNIENVVKGANPPSTLSVEIGPASASVTGTPQNTALATAQGATADVQVLPGVGCDAKSLLDCITNPTAYAAPLIEIKVAPAESTDYWDNTNWHPSTKAALATVDLNIPGDPQSISVAPGQSLDLLGGTPLESVVDLGSANTQGWSGKANGATLDLAKGVNGGILLDLGSSSITGTDSPASPSVVPVKGHPGTPEVLPVQRPANTPPVLAPVRSATFVHTGAWWSGSLPYIAGLAVLGGGLLGWPRLRRGGTGLGSLLRAARR